MKHTKTTVLIGMLLMVPACWCGEDPQHGANSIPTFQPRELLGYYEGACFQKAAATMDEQGNMVVKCLPEGHIMAQPLVVLYYTTGTHRDSPVTFAWWEDTARIEPVKGGPTYFMPGGADTSLALTAWSTSGTRSLCVNATFESFTATYRAHVVQVGETDVYEEYAEYATSTLDLGHTCPPRANLPLYCNEHSFNYRCSCNKAEPPAPIISWLHARGASAEDASAALAADAKGPGAVA